MLTQPPRLTWHDRREQHHRPARNAGGRLQWPGCKASACTEQQQQADAKQQVQAHDGGKSFIVTVSAKGALQDDPARGQRRQAGTAHAAARSRQFWTHKTMHSTPTPAAR